MHKNTIKPRNRLVLSRETVRQLSDRELRFANGAVISTHETITDEMGQCCWVSPVTPCV